MGLGLGLAAQLLQDGSQIVVSFRSVGGKENGFASLRLGLLQAAQTAQHHGQVPPHVGARRLCGCNLAQIVYRVGEAPEPVGGNTAEVARLDVVGLSCQAGLGDAPSALVVAGLIGGDGGRE